MKTKEQKVECYLNEWMTDIKISIENYINKGWFVHSFFERNGDVLVVYERDLESWN